MVEIRVVCWDLDETLGSFRNIVSARSKGRGNFPNPEDSYTLRKDLIKTLNRMMNKGYHHVITSSAKLEYSEKVLQAVCLDAYFDYVFGRQNVTDGMWGKKYMPAAAPFHLNEEEACSRMLVIANMDSDEPIDVGLVFVHDQRGLEESAFDYETIAETLWARGEGSFKRGFDAFFESGKRVTCLDQEFDFTLVSTQITDGIAVELGYKNSPCTAGLKIPTLFNIRAV